MLEQFKALCASHGVTVDDALCCKPRLCWPDEAEAIFDFGCITTRSGGSVEFFSFDDNQHSEIYVTSADGWKGFIVTPPEKFGREDAQAFVRAVSAFVDEKPEFMDYAESWDWGADDA